MNEKILLSEIQRIQEMMGLKNHLILEQLNKFADELNSKLDGLLKKLDNNEIDLAQFYGSISDIRTKISTSSLNINERNALNKILDDIDLERKSQVMGKTEANKLVDSLKMKIKNDNILKNAEAKTKVKEIIDLDAIKKSDEYIKIVFDMPTPQVERFKVLFKTYPNDSEVLKLYNSAEELINDKSDSVAKVFSRPEIGFDYNATKKYFKEWMENNIDFSNAFKKSDLENLTDEIEIGNPIVRQNNGQEEDLGDLYPDISRLYDGIIEKNGVDLTDIERKLLDDIEEWKKGKEPNFDSYFTNRNEPENIEIFDANIKKQELENLGLDSEIIEKYIRIKQKTKKKFIWEKDLESDVEDFINGKKVNFEQYKSLVKTIKNVNSTIYNFLIKPYKNDISNLIRNSLKSMDEFDFVESTIANTFKNGLTDDIRMALNSNIITRNVLEKLENPTSTNQFGYFVKKGTNEWVQLNMLDTNWADNLNFFRDLLKDYLKKNNSDFESFSSMSSIEQQTLLKNFFDDIKANPKKVTDKIKEFPDQYIKKSTKFTKLGDEAEQEVQEFFKKQGYEVIWSAEKGNIFDKKGVDLIVKKDGKVNLVQIKSTDSKIKYFPETNKVGFYQTRGIFLDDGLAAFKNNDGRIVIFPKEESKFYVTDKTTNEKKLYNEFSKLPRYMELDADKIIKNF
jgi:hypothetical protein